MSKKDLAIIIQARTGSTRFPNKTIMPFFEEKSILEIIIEKLQHYFNDIDIILATTTNVNDISIINIAEKKKIKYFRGDENNVLKRFIESAELFNKKNIIRICSDNPFLDMGELKKLISISLNSDYDYISFKTSDNKPTIKTHFGLWAEFTTLHTLKRINSLTTSNIYLEHVTNYIYENPKLFSINLIPIDDIFNDRKDIRLTIDTEEDFIILKNLYKIMSSKHNIFNMSDLLSEIISCPNMLDIMKKQILINTK